MKNNKLAIVVTVLILLFNFALYYIVRIDGGSLILSATITMAEVLALLVTLWYWMNHNAVKKVSEFHHLP